MIIGTATWGYLRLRRSDYTEADLSRWLDQIRAQPWEKAFVYFKHEEKAKGPETASRSVRWTIMNPFDRYISLTFSLSPRSDNKSPGRQRPV